MSTVSVVISAYNEEKKIGECLESVKNLADEIIVMDNESTDNTQEIAHKYTKNVYRQKNDPTRIDIQKNAGFEKASGDWILNLDADERVTPELAKEIKEKIVNCKLKIGNSGVAGYWIPRKNIIFGKWIEHTGWYPDYQLRLFKKGKGRFVSEHVHEPLSIDGTTSKLISPLSHNTYTTVGQFLYKHFFIYAPSEAVEKRRQGYKFHWQDVILIPTGEFLGRYFARKGYKDGLHGLILSLGMAMYHFAVVLFLWEDLGFKEKELDLNDVEKVLSKVGSDTMHWVTAEKVECEKSFIKKILLKVRGKVA